MKLILGSASPGRAQVLTRARVPFDVLVSHVDEDAVGAAHPGVTPAQLAALLAQAKGHDVAARLSADGTGGGGRVGAGVTEPTLVVGCDSVFELDGVAYGKPYEPEVALERWRAQAGRTGVLHTGQWLGLLLPTPPGPDGAGAEAAVGPDGAGAEAAVGPEAADGVPTGVVRETLATVSSQVRFAAADEATLQAYVATGEPLHCAGAFTVDGAGAALVEEVRGDPNAVIGLSVARLRRQCEELGVRFIEVWGSGDTTA